MYVITNLTHAYRGFLLVNGRLWTPYCCAHHLCMEGLYTEVHFY